jgi:hypothetical protein
MLRETYELVKRNPGVFAALVFGFCLPVFLDEILKSKTGSQGAQLFILFLTFRSIQQMVLAGGDAKAINIKGNFSYFWKHVALLATVIVVAVIPLAIGGKTVPNLLLLLLIALIGYPVALAALGTWPMGALGHVKVSFADALRCGGNRFGKSFLRILTAFAVQIGIGVAVALLVAEPAFFNKGNLNILGIVAEIFCQAVSVLSLAYISVVITHNYLDFFGPTDLPGIRSGLLPSRRF